MSILKILIVVPFYKPAYVYGGPIRSVSALAEALSQLGFSVTVYTTNANGAADLDVETSNASNINGVVVYYFPRVKGWALFSSPRLREACETNLHSFDFVYIVSSWTYPHIAAARGARRAQVPYVISPRTAFMKSTWRGKRLKKGLYHFLAERRKINTAAAIHYTSQVELRESKWLRLRSKAVVVTNPVDISEFSCLPPFGEFRSQFGLGVTEKLILYMGRVEPRKQVDLAIRSFSHLLGGASPVRLVIAGPEEDDYISSLRTLVKSLEIEKSVLFAGMISGRVRLAAFRDADLFVLTSLAENFAVSAVEAMAAGLPLVLSETAGVAAEVASTGSGIVVSLEEGAIANAMKMLISSEDLRRKAGDAGRKLASTAYAPDAVARLWVDSFLSSLRSKRESAL